MKVFFIALGVLLLLICFWIGCSVLGWAGWFAGRTADVVQQQIDPAELLRKYELFKDESAQLDAKIANIHVQEKKIKRISSIPVDKLDRTNREQLMLWEQEFEGLKFSYNGLAADYNSQMSKINYAFCNVGQLPKGATVPLPREYKPYLEE